MKLKLLVGLALCLGLGSAGAEELKTLFFGDIASFDYAPEVPAEKGKVVRKDDAYLKSVVPESVLSYNGKEVEIAGYMLPLVTKGEKVSEFLLLPNTMACCYGQMPRHNEFVFVKMKKGIGLLENVPLRIVGKLTIAESWENGYFSHLYFLQGTELKYGFGQTISLEGL